MSDYIGILIVLSVFTTLLYLAITRDGHRRKLHRFNYDEIMIDQDKQSQTDLVARKKEIYDKLMNLEPFDYGGKDEVTVGPLICDPEPGLIITGIFSTKFRDVMKPKLHGLQGRVKVRQISKLISSRDWSAIKLGSFGEWEDIGPVKKEL